MDPTAVNNYPVFYVKNKDFSNVDNEHIRCSLKRFEEYIHECFSILPYNKIKIQNEEKIILQQFCDVLVFNQCEQIICAIIEKECNEKTKIFFQELEIRIKNNEFKNNEFKNDEFKNNEFKNDEFKNDEYKNREEKFLKLFVSIWNNFSLVLNHISDILQSFIAYSKNMCCNFFEPSQIFNYIWKKYINEYVIIKDMFISCICNYLTYDKLYCEKFIYEYLSVNVCKKYGRKRYDFKKKQIIHIERLQRIQKSYQLNNETTNKQTNKISEKNHISIKDDSTENISNKIKKEDYIQMGDNKNSDDNNNSDDSYNSDDNNNNIFNSDDSYNSNSSICDTKEKYRNSKKKKKNINDKVLSLSIQITDMLNLYEDFEGIYKNETYTFYKERIEKYKKDIETLGYENCKFDFPIIVENYLCHEQIRSQKFLKEHTEISILNMLKDLLLVKNKDILFNDSYIKYCIINEKYEPLRSIYLYSLNLDNLEKFSNIFFNVVDNIGTELINNVINKRNDSSLLNNAIVKLTNFKLNVDRIIIMSFTYSSYFMKKWRESFEHFINKGIQAETYMPIILSIYLNNLLTMYNACLRKLKKYYILNRKIKNKRSLFNNLLFEVDWNNYCTQPITETVDFYDISTDSDNMLGIKKYLRKKIKNKRKNINCDTAGDYMKMKQMDNNMYNNNNNNNNLYVNNDLHKNVYHDNFNINKRNNEAICFYLFKINKLFKKYHVIGKYIMNMITVILSLFRYVSDKEKFEKYYRTYMCKRLINDASFNIVLDVKVFKTLKKECGAQFTKKIEIILKDMKFTSKALMKFYKDLPKNVNYFLKRKKYAVNIIFNESWEYVNTENNVIYPQMIKMCNEAFLLFYKKYNKSKNIKFLPLLGLCTLRMYFKNMKEGGLFNLENEHIETDKRDDNNNNNNKYSDDDNQKCSDDDNSKSSDDDNSKSSDDDNSKCSDDDNSKGSDDDNSKGSDDDDLENEDNSSTYNKKAKKKIYITVTILQALVLLLFNKKNEFHINEIKELTGISNENIIRYLKSIYTEGETHILIYDKEKETLKLNFAFRSMKQFLIVNYNDSLYKDDMGTTNSLTQEDNETEDKSLHIDAAIVKYLKNNGKSSERKICSVVKDQMDTVSNEQIKNRISSLLSREFIFFKNNNYHYEL